LKYPQNMHVSTGNQTCPKIVNNMLIQYYNEIPVPALTEWIQYWIQYTHTTESN